MQYLVCKQVIVYEIKLFHVDDVLEFIIQEPYRSTYFNSSSRAVIALCFKNVPGPCDGSTNATYWISLGLDNLRCFIQRYSNYDVFSE